MTPFHATRLEHNNRTQTPCHHHAEGQFYWLTKGMISLTTPGGQWALTPGCAGWLPPGCPHQSVACGEIQGWSLLLPPDLCDALPDEPTLVTADSFLAALLARLARSGQEDSEVVRLRLIGVLLDAFLQAPTAALQLLLPTDKRARAIAQQLLAHPDDDRRQAELANRAGLSVRTLSRLFIGQTGLTFARWRQQARILRSLEGLAAGLPVAQVAAQHGYDNTSAYIAVFRQRFGVTPGIYFLSTGKYS